MVDIWVEGGQAELGFIEAQLRTSRGRIGQRGSQVVRRSTLAGEAIAKARAPVRTGYMKSTIGHSFAGDGRHGAMEGEWGAEARYSRFVELGTRFMAPQPFVGPSLDAVTPGFLAAVEAISDPLD
ncbi:HK97-gp10 family putative phage morphogenesis protein [Micromonospora sp. NPDC049891]|uniref:HK97-gp10 family putative phage morphogenesis protein n=1 Tax=Micromonospora sp. NPDC049891 TaxID=3155655 RepID=UPI0033EA0030